MHSWGLTAQSVTISYEYASFTGCNIFASPVTYQGYSHQTNIGFPGYAGHPDYWITMQTAVNNTTEHKVTQFSIAYNFKIGYTYSVKVYAAATGSNYYPSIGVKISPTDGGANSSTNCSPGPQGLSAATAAGYGQGSLGPSFAWTANLINNMTMTSTQGYLLVAALPASGMTGTNTVKLRKIEITESAPPFTISPASASMTCGYPITQTFTVSNPQSISGVTGYTWNLGSSNGWLYNGSAAPSSISTAGNTLQLTSACGTTAPSNVSVTVDVNNQAHSTLTSNINFSSALPSSVQFNGAGYACTQSPTSVNYSIYEPPCNATISWSASPSGMVTLSTVGNTVDVTPVTNASGTVTLTASITNSCGNNASFNKTINLANTGCLCLPAATGLYDGPGNYGSGTRKLHWTPQSGVNFYYVFYRLGPTFQTGGYGSGTSSFDLYHQPGQTFQWWVQGICEDGLTAPSAPETFVMPRAMLHEAATELDPSDYKLTIFPVPASKRLNVSFGANANGTVTLVITDLLGKTFKNINFGVQKGLNLHHIDVSGMPHGIYFLKITRNGKAETHKIVIQK
jgi:hypothetical protein